MLNVKAGTVGTPLYSMVTLNKQSRLIQLQLVTLSLLKHVETQEFLDLNIFKAIFEIPKPRLAGSC